MNKKILLFIALVLVTFSMKAQQTYISNDNTTADWIDFVWTKSQSWMNDRPRFNGNNTYTPDYGYWERVDLYGYITRNGDFTVDGGGALHIYDTLRITGSMLSEQLINVHSGGLLIVEGDYEANNGGVNTIGGTVVVLGNMLATGGADVDISGGDFYLVGDLTTTGEGEAFNGSSTPPSGYFKDEGDLQAEDDLYSFATGSPLPVEFVHVGVKERDDKVIVNWATASEVNNDYFTIERSQDGVQFTAIGAVKGSGTTFELKAYSFADNEPLQGVNFYRVRQTDFDGASDVSRVVSFESGHDELMDFKVFPNPADHVANIVLPVQGSFTIEIVDSMGVLHKTFSIDNATVVQVQVDDLKRGYYFVICKSPVKRLQKRLLVK